MLGFTKRETGNRGERYAKEYLQKKGFTILHCNYVTRFGELDIVAKRGGKIHFIEVKTRTSDIKGKPYEAVNRVKKSHLRMATIAYIQKFNLSGYLHSFDVISIIMEDEEDVLELQHFEQVAF